MGFEINFDGLDKFIKDLQKKVESIGGDIPLNEFFDTEFMNKNTSFQSIEEFFQQGGFTVNNKEDLDNIDESLLDKFINEKTNFSSWEEMKQVAGEIYVSKELKRMGF